MRAENVRLTVAALSLSAAAIVGLVVHEGYTERAVIPTQGDVPTLGFGSTVHEDGRRVRMGERTDPVNALKKAHAHITREEARFRASLPGVHLTQGEYDVYMDWVYQYGMGAWHKPKSPRTWLLRGDYVGACNALLTWRFQAGRDCKLPQNWGPKGCKGVWTRQQKRHADCMAMQ